MRRSSAATFLVAAVLALAVAPSAFPSHVTAINTESGMIGPGGSLIVSGTIDCTAGYVWFMSTLVRQKSGKTFNTGQGNASGTCTTTGPESFTTNPFFGQGPFKSGQAVAQSDVSVCDPSHSECATASDLTEIRIRR